MILPYATPRRPHAVPLAHRLLIAAICGPVCLLGLGQLMAGLISLGYAAAGVRSEALPGDSCWSMGLVLMGLTLFAMAGFPLGYVFWQRRRRGL